ncbi:PREDICTED: eukaryotic translation initiation factor 4 gamma 3 [Thamnophis sirtalis]|uniref:Eukaryotic translation initiation factor 4 gamma 3 n=1 Tax=Thamnophis sirtalis TaxID=35019 RepID=A0A6I9YMC2_9SAUR|nr:PREDICTED: eukaryotic translation initiation factor 4 gamma 3 [Thamnophis sirtalis]
MRALQAPPPQQIPRGPVQQPLEDRIFTPTVSAVYSTVTQVARQPGPPAPSPYSPHEINKGHPALAATPPGHASSPGLTQQPGGRRDRSFPPHPRASSLFEDPRELVQRILGCGMAPYPAGQNAAPTTLVYPQAPQAMSTQPQTRSPPGRAVPIPCLGPWKRRKVLEQSPVYRSLAGRGWIKYYLFAAGPRPAHHQGGFRPIQFFQRPQIQPPRATIQNSSPSLRPGAQTPTAVYQANQHIMMVNHLPIPYPMPQGPQYCIPQYRHSGPPYVGPPQQYPVQPPGPGPFYPGPGPGEFPNAYGAPFYPSQPVYPSTPIIVPTPQQQPLPPTKREKKTIRIRDPNQGGRDITEEIMSGGGSRNPTPPAVRPTSTPTPPQQQPQPQLPSQVPEHNAVACGTVESSPLPASSPIATTGSLKQEEKPKTDPVLKSPSPALRPEPSGERKEPAGLTAETPLCPETSLEPPGPAGAPSLAVVPPSRSPLASGSQDGCELASPPQEAPPPLPPPLARAGPCLELPSCPLAEEADPERCREPSRIVVPNDLHQTASANLSNELNGVPERVTLSENILEPGEPKEAVPPALEPASEEEAEAECVPPAASVALPGSPSPPPRPPHSPLALPVALAPHLSPSPPRSPSPPLPPAGAPAALQGDLDREESPKLTLNEDTPNAKDELEVDGRTEEEELEEDDVQGLSAKIDLEEAPTAAAAPKTWKKPKEQSQAADEGLEAAEEPEAEDLLGGERIPEAEQEARSLNTASPSDLKVANVTEENGEQEGEPVRNGAEEAPEREGGCTESASEAPACQQKPEQWKPVDTEGKKQYDRDFLLDFQFMPACIQKPEGLPPISDVVLDKINQPKLPLRMLDSRILARGPDFTPAFADFGRQVPSGRGSAACKVQPPPGLPSGTRCGTPACPLLVSSHPQLRNLQIGVRSLPGRCRAEIASANGDCRRASIVHTSCLLSSLLQLKVPMANKPDSTVNFRKLLLNRCQKEFEKDKADDDVFEKKQKELEAATTPEERTRLHDELEEAKDKARRRSIGNIKFIGELFKLKMLTEAIMHDCVVKLLKNHDEESLECLCRLLTTIGKDLDFEKAKPRMDQYFNQMEKIVKERKTSSRIRFMLQDVIDLRQCNWISRRADQGPKTIEQIHKEAKIEEQEEQRKVQQLMTKDKRRPGVQRVEEGGWNTVQGAKNSRVLDPTKFLKITKPSIDEKIQLVPKAQLGSWGKGSSGGAKASEIDCLRPSATSLNRFSALQAPASTVSGTTLELDPRRALTSRGSTGREKNDNKLPPSAASRPNAFLRLSSGSKEQLLDNQAQEEQRREMLETVKQLTGGLESDRNSTEMEKSKTREAVKSEAPAPHPQEKPGLSDEEIERKCKSIIDEFLHINDYKEAVQCVEELNVPGILPVFVQVGVESTLERSQITRDHMGQLLYQLVQSEKLSKQDFFKGFSDTLETADDMAIDIPHIWLYLAELVTPMLKEGGISMRELVIEFSKPLLPVRRAGVLLSKILHLLCKQMSHKKVAALWREAGLSWKDFLPEEDDVHAFLLEQKLDFTETDSPSSSEALSPRELSAEELNRQLEKLIVEEEAGDEQIFDWVEANLDESQMSSPTFLRALMTAVCKAAVLVDSSSLRVDTTVIKRRVPILLKYLDSDTEKELQALYALQASIVKLDQPPNLLRMFFDCLYDEEVISEDAFYKWESSKDPAEQNGKGVALKSVTAFFTWLREAEEESEDN